MFLVHHVSPTASADHAEACLAAGDAVGAAEAANVGLESIKVQTKTMQLGQKMMPQEHVNRAHHGLEPVRTRLLKLLDASRSQELRAALKRTKTKELLAMTPEAATALVERWLPMGPRGTTQRVESGDIETALRPHAGSPEPKRRAAIEGMLLSRHAAMLAARMDAAGQPDKAGESARLSFRSASPASVGGPRGGGSDVSGLPAWG